MNNPTQSVICFGEILWDFLPHGLFPGGAPHNVAYHLHQLGLNAYLVSAVGQDLLGDALLRRLHHLGLSVEGLVRLPRVPTGYVSATLEVTGNARYNITPYVAWDQITLSEATLRAAMDADALVFGSLAQRSACNRASLDRLLAILPSTAQRIFDVNLRPPHDDLALVLELAKRATLLKLNATEAARFSAASPDSGSDEANARAIATLTGCANVCITAGERGAGMLTDDIWHWEAGRPVQVRDTVGSGDAFLAGLLAGLLRYRELPALALTRACRLGEFVAARDGATPAYQCDAHGHPTNL